MRSLRRLMQHAGLAGLGGLGYDSRIVRQLPPAHQRRLMLAGGLSALSAALFALSGGYIAFLGAYSDGFLWVIGILVTLGIFLFALNMHRLFVTAGGFGHHTDDAVLAHWRPDRLRIVCVGALAALFALPYVLMVDHTWLDGAMRERVAVMTALYRETQTRRIDARIAGLTGDIVAAEQALGRAGMPPEPGTEAILATARTAHATARRRKALVLAAGTYRGATPMPGAVSSAHTLAQGLEAEGFAVTASVDEASDTAWEAVDRFIKQLESGDTCLVYVSGYGYERHGRIHFVPRDLPPSGGPGAVNLHQLVEEIAAKRPQLQAIALNLWRPAEAAVEERAANDPAVLPLGANAIALATTTAVAGPDAGLASLALRIAKAADDPAALAGLVRTRTGAATPAVGAAGALRIKASLPVATAAHLDRAQMLPDDVAARFACLGSHTAQLECLRAQVRVALAAVRELETQRATTVAAMVADYQRNLEGSSMLRERLFLELARPGRMVTIAFAAVLLMVGGDVLRDRSVHAVRAYERLRLQHSRAAVETQFVKERVAVADLLQQYPHIRLPDGRWHEQPTYFRPAGAATGREIRAAEPPRGSTEELLAILTRQSRGGIA
ncbi:hypothetical protein E4K72_04745 [Oxalobacteraceae bacterium OM1]|nr:hypothetical protein E4K72_04745 [Oxalobacteraceae bacterium OM1]